MWRLILVYIHSLCWGTWCDEDLREQDVFTWGTSKPYADWTISFPQHDFFFFLFLFSSFQRNLISISDGLIGYFSCFAPLLNQLIDSFSYSFIELFCQSITPSLIVSWWDLLLGHLLIVYCLLVRLFTLPLDYSLYTLLFLYITLYILRFLAT